MNNTPTYISGESKKPCLFLPYLGEFGIMIFQYIKFVHFYKCPWKTIMCPKEDRIFFPSANNFEDFPLISKREEKYNYMNHPRYKQIADMMKNFYPNYDIALFFSDINYNIVTNLIFDFDLPQYVEKRFDVVIGSRGKNLYDFKNYPYWDIISEKLNSLNYKIAVVGSKNFSNSVKGAFHSWEFGNDSKNVCLILKMSKLYIGTDCGISHLACFLQIPSILINAPNSSKWNNYPKDFFMNQLCEINKNFTKRISAWNDPQHITDEIIKYLK